MQSSPLFTGSENVRSENRSTRTGFTWDIIELWVKLGLTNTLSIHCPDAEFSFIHWIRECKKWKQEHKDRFYLVMELTCYVYPCTPRRVIQGRAKTSLRTLSSLTLYTNLSLCTVAIYMCLLFIQAWIWAARVLASRVSFWHPGPQKIPILGGKDTLSFGQNSF